VAASGAPAMAVGLADKLLTMEDMAAMVDARAAKLDRPKVYTCRVLPTVR
jgi:hypothetical protein